MLPEKQSYAALAGNLADYEVVEDPTTDLSAEAGNELRCDVAQMTRTAIRAWVKFQYVSSAVVLLDWDANWKVGTPTPPIVNRASTGIYGIEWPVSVTDERGITRNLNLLTGWGNIQKNACSTAVAIDAPNEASVSIWNNNLSFFDDPDTGPCTVFLI